MADLSKNFAAIVVAASALGGGSTAGADVKPTAQDDGFYSLQRTEVLSNTTFFKDGAKGAVDAMMNDPKTYLGDGKPAVFSDNNVRARIVGPAGSGITGECVVSDSSRLKSFFSRASDLALLTCSTTNHVTGQTMTETRSFDSNEQARQRQKAIFRESPGTP